MKPTKPCLAIRFDIDKVEQKESLFYGRYCWRIFFEAILRQDSKNLSILAEGELHEGDTARTLASQEYVYALAIQSPHRKNLDHLRELLLASEEFQKFATAEPFRWDSAVDGEPLPWAGTFNRDAILEVPEGRIFNPKVVLDELLTGMGHSASSTDSAEPDSTRLAELAEDYIRMEPPSDGMSEMMAEVPGEKPAKAGYKAVGKGAIDRSGNLMNDMKIISVARCLKETAKNIKDSAGLEATAMLVMQAVLHYLKLESVQKLFLAPYRQKSGKTNAQFKDLPDAEKCRVLTGVENVLLEVYRDLPSGSVITHDTILAKVGKIVASAGGASRRPARRKPKRSRLATTLGTLAILTVAILVLAGFVAAVVGVISWKRNQVKKDEMLHTLKLLQMSFEFYGDHHEAYPPAAILSNDGKPLLSWRVDLLARMGGEEKQLYKRFKLDEPWDSPHNKALLSEMPESFKSWDKTANQAYSTYYRIFVHEPGTDDDRPREWPPFSLGSSKGLRGYAIERAKVLLCVESAEAVPWTKPTGLKYGTTIPLPKLGGQLKGGFCAVTMTGNKEFIPYTISELELRSRIRYGSPTFFPEIRDAKKQQKQDATPALLRGETAFRETAAEDPETGTEDARTKLRDIQKKQQDRLKKALDLPAAPPPPTTPKP